MGRTKQELEETIDLYADAIGDVGILARSGVEASPAVKADLFDKIVDRMYKFACDLLNISPSEA